MIGGENHRDASVDQYGMHFCHCEHKNAENLIPSSDNSEDRKQSSWTTVTWTTFEPPLGWLFVDEPFHCGKWIKFLQIVVW